MNSNRFAALSELDATANDEQVRAVDKFDVTDLSAALKGARSVRQLLSAVDEGFLISLLSISL